MHMFLSVQHQMFLHHLLLTAANTPVMIWKYRHFAQDAYTAFTAPPWPLGKPTMYGATILFTLYDTPVESWKKKLPFYIFHNHMFLTSEVHKYYPNGELISTKI